MKKSEDQWTSLQVSEGNEVDVNLEDHNVAVDNVPDIRQVHVSANEDHLQVLTDALNLKEKNQGVNWI